MDKYAIKITKDNLSLINVLSPFKDVVQVTEKTRFFLFTIDDLNTTTDHDIVEEEDFLIYDGKHFVNRIVIE